MITADYVRNLISIEPDKKIDRLLEYSIIPRFKQSFSKAVTISVQEADQYMGYTCSTNHVVSQLRYRGFLVQYKHNPKETQQSYYVISIIST